MNTVQHGSFVLKGTSLGQFRPQKNTVSSRKLYGHVLVPPNVPQVTIAALSVMLIVVAFFVFFEGRFTRTVQVQGRLSPTGGEIKLYPNTAGNISHIFVREGERVLENSPIARIDAARVDGGSRTNVAESILAAKQKIDLLLQRIELREKQFLASTEVLEIQTSNTLKSIMALETNIGIQSEISASLEQSVNDSNGLIEQGHISRVEHENRKQSLLAAQQKVANLARDKQLQLGEIENIDARKTLQKIEYDSDISAMRSELIALNQTIKTLETEATSLIVAPVEGQVAAVFENVGKYVNSDSLIGSILPTGSVLVAELFVPSKAIVFVSEGQAVQLSYEAFPSQQFGPLLAEVTSVSRTALLPSEYNGGVELSEPMYRILAAVHDQNISTDSQTLQLQSGMRLTATILLEELSLSAWIWSNLQK